MHRAHMCNAFDVCNVQHTLRLYKRGELLHVIQPGATQLKQFGLAVGRFRKTTSPEKTEMRIWREARRRLVQNMKGLYVSPRLCIHRSPTRRFSLIETSSASARLHQWAHSSAPTAAGKSLRILTAALHTGPKRKIFTHETSRNKYHSLKYLEYIPRNTQHPPLLSISAPIHLCSVWIMQKVSTGWINFWRGWMWLMGTEECHTSGFQRANFWLLTSSWLKMSEF